MLAALIDLGNMQNIKLRDRILKDFNRSRNLSFLFLILVFALILYFTNFTRGLYLAPPFAVSTYLAVYERNTRFSGSVSIISSYIFVLFVTFTVRIFISDIEIGLIVSTIIAMAFISFTRFEHPPMIALTIFSFLVPDFQAFAESTLIALVLIISGRLLALRLLGPDIGQSKEKMIENSH